MSPDAPRRRETPRRPAAADPGGAVETLAGEPTVLEFDADGRHMPASGPALERLGFPADRMIGRTTREAGLPEEYVAALEDLVAEAVSRDAERIAEAAFRDSSGPRVLILRARPREGGGANVVVEEVTATRRTVPAAGAEGAFRALVDNSPDAIARLDRDLTIVDANAALAEVLGLAPDELPGGAIDGPGVPPAVAAALGRTARGALGDDRIAETSVMVPGRGGPRWFDVRLLPERDGRERTVGLILSCAEVTERVHREREQRALRRVATAVARTGDLREIARTAAEETRELLGAAVAAIHRFGEDGTAELVASEPAPGPGAPIGPRHALDGTGAVGRVARSGRPARIDDHHRELGGEVPRELRESGLRSDVAAPLWSGGRLWGALAAGAIEPGAFGDEDERRLSAIAELAALAVANAEARAELARLAETDALTGLANRRAFTRRLEGEIARARRHGHMLAVAILDIDEFKRVNDTCGHEIGDQVLVEVARRLRQNCRSGELVARHGGEEFAWILPQIGAAGSLVPIERARAAVAGIDVPGLGRVTLSAGVCDLSMAGEAGELVRRADRALYSAKEAGRDRVHSASV